MTASALHTAIFVNLAANNGQATAKWGKIRDSVLEILGGTPMVHPYQPPEQIDDLLHAILMTPGEKLLISAGGDGSLNHLINILMRYPDHIREKVTVGAIGLGSSNDALKPFREQIYGIPVNIRLGEERKVDVGLAWIGRPVAEKRFFLNNASIGVTARANALFNKGDLFIRLTKRRCTQIAILYAAVRTILTHKNIPAVIDHARGRIESNLSAVSVLKTPFLAGMLRYDQHIDRGDGRLGMNLCDDMGRLELLKTVWHLAHARFQGRPKCFSLSSNEVSIECRSEVPIELDGEICFGRSFHFRVCPGALKMICST